MLWATPHQVAERPRFDARGQHLMQPLRQPAHVVELALRHPEQRCHGPVLVRDDATLAPWVARVIAKVDARRLIAVKRWRWVPGSGGPISACTASPAAINAFLLATPCLRVFMWITILRGATTSKNAKQKRHASSL